MIPSRDVASFSRRALLQALALHALAGRVLSGQARSHAALRPLSPGAVTDDWQVTVLLKAVTFIDGAGRKLLADMHRQGAELVAEGCMMKAIVGEIKRGDVS